jgi:YHS domain-containing protein
MYKLSIVSIFILTAGLLMANITVHNAVAAQKEGRAQTICPVMGDPINKKYFVDYKGFRIYFCCKDCPETFKKNPGKYMKILQESGVTLEKAPEVSTEKGDSDKHKHHHMD